MPPLAREMLRRMGVYIAKDGTVMIIALRTWLGR
jgi:hypothetical protein